MGPSCSLAGELLAINDSLGFSLQGAPGKYCVKRRVMGRLLVPLEEENTGDKRRQAVIPSLLLGSP